MVDLIEKSENTTSDGTGIDITDEFEVDKSDVKLFSINELVPPSAPITIPYLEVYRTNELEYVPYISPYNIGCSSSSDSSDSSSTDSDTDLSGTDDSSTDSNSDSNSDSNTDANSDSNNSNSNT